MDELYKSLGLPNPDEAARSRTNLQRQMNPNPNDAYRSGMGIQMNPNDAYRSGGVGMQLNPNDAYRSGGGMQMNPNDAYYRSGGGMQMNSNDAYRSGGGMQLNPNDAYYRSGGGMQMQVDQQSSVQPPMDSQMFKHYGSKIIDWAIEYMETLPTLDVTPKEKPGYMKKLLPTVPPMQGERFDNVLNDLNKIAVAGMAHWQHNQFFAYFPAGNSWPSVLGDIFSNGTAGNGQTWKSCPIITELETIVMDWCCKFLGLPKFFLSSSSEPNSDGQGVLQCSASEAIFYSMVWARQDALKKLKAKYPDKPKAVLLNMLVAYCNNECHCCVERAAMMGCIRIRKLKADHIGTVRSNVLKSAILEDKKNGLVPFYHCAIIGSTGVTSCDDLMEVGPLCKMFDMWLHVDAAYAGSAFLLPELDHLKQGYEYVWSTNINTNKWMLCNFEASLHWVRYKSKAVESFAGNLNQVRHYPNGVGPDLRHYGVATSRRLRAIKLYFVIRCYGVEGLRRYCRRHINLAKLFEMYVRRDHRFEVVAGPVRFGLVAFRLKGYNFLTDRLLDALNSTHKIHMVSSHFHDKVVIRFALCAESANERDIDRAWRKIDHLASQILRDYEREHLDDTAMKRVFMEQHFHDDLHETIYDSEDEKEDTEAKEAYRNLARAQQEDAFARSLSTANDGNYGHGTQQVFQEHDRYVQSHPDMYDERDAEVAAIGKVVSMLHLQLLNQVQANNPRNPRN